MLVEGTKSKTAFGWQHSTHRLITKNLVGLYNFGLPSSVRFNYDILKYSCVEPDFSRKAITKFIHGHFADIDNLSKEPPDAYALAKKYSHKAMEAHKSGMYNKRDDYLGYALHFIQDMLNPKHVVFEKLPKGHPERIEHKKFEQIAESIQKKILARARLNQADLSLSFFKTVLPDAMRKTKDLHLKLLNKDYNCYEEIASKALKITYQVCSDYLARMTNDMKLKTPVKVKLNGQLELFSDEAFVA